jgi:hypothetical protein
MPGMSVAHMQLQLQLCLRIPHLQNDTLSIWGFVARKFESLKWNCLQVNDDDTVTCFPPKMSYSQV